MEVLLETVKQSLQFAHEAARECHEAPAKDCVQVAPGYSGFWFGVAVGAVVSCFMLPLICLISQCLTRAIPYLQPGRAITLGNLETAKATLPSSPSIALENRPATPAALRALGLA